MKQKWVNYKSWVERLQSLITLVDCSVTEHVVAVGQLAVLWPHCAAGCTAPTLGAGRCRPQPSATRKVWRFTR